VEIQIKFYRIYGDIGHSAATSLPCLTSLCYLIADKRFAFGSPKPTSWASFIRKTLGVIFEGSLFSNLDLTRRVKKLLNKLNLSDYH